MAFSRAVLKKLSKEEVINLALNYQIKFDSTLAGIRNKASELGKEFQKLELGLPVSEHAARMRVINNPAVTDSTISENALFIQRMLCFIPDSTGSKDMEKTVLKVLMVDRALSLSMSMLRIVIKKNSDGSKIVKFSRRNDAAKILSLKKNLKEMDLSSLGINAN